MSWQKVEAQRVIPLIDPPGILFEFATAEQAEEFLNDGVNSDRKQRHSPTQVVVTLAVEQT